MDPQGGTMTPTPYASRPGYFEGRLALGSENDSPAREWARYVQRAGEIYSSGLELRVMLRRDRIARGSDHMSFAHEGFPAIRMSEAKENYRRQHQTPRMENGVQYGDDLAHFDAFYASRLCRALAGAIGALGFSPSPPREVVLASSNNPDGKLKWTLPQDARIADVILYRRPADPAPKRNSFRCRKRWRSPCRAIANCAFSSCATPTSSSIRWC